MITLLGKYNGKCGIIELPAADGKITKFCDELGADSIESLKIQYAGTGKYWGMDSALLENALDGNARFHEINLLSYITSRMGEKQMSEFDEKICDFKGDFDAERMKLALNEGYRNLSGEKEVLTIYNGENAAEIIAAERNLLKPYPEMNKDVFWQMIENSRQQCGGDHDMMKQRLTQELSSMSPQDIRLYKDINDEYIQLADRQDLYEFGSALNGGMSDDAYMDFRSWLISQGKEVFMTALENHKTLDLELLKPIDHYYEWESFNYIASYAYEINTGGDLYEHPSVITQEQRDELINEVQQHRQTQEADSGMTIQ